MQVRLTASDQLPLDVPALLAANSDHLVVAINSELPLEVALAEASALITAWQARGPS